MNKEKARDGMLQVKIFEGDDMDAINKWLYENPDIEVTYMNMCSMHDYYSDDRGICNQWINTIIVYKVVKRDG